MFFHQSYQEQHSILYTYLCSCLTGNSETLIHQAPRDWFKVYPIIPHPRSWSYCCGTVK
ncbi:hypothetical protein BD408DRAFT_408947 [Parasitella parasitica]|nr:hypothetical protein BD408DRAFT_425170 [Parasitella parasitica]KAI8639610.1 hypothetical protein BD408DRAFT_421000 [Parasitella parasitica]KAI8642053.1 hypothetical protein BD408DRAFT_417008 [Parasitella parasitica]KAI8646507.1 hypothetical protein BD408DRAFT_410351 [Parasitella parasitica]KAI8647297.1 hypothetical protein BD408DRAFT_408947 [Parasitella parasitica]